MREYGGSERHGGPVCPIREREFVRNDTLTTAREQRQNPDASKVGDTRERRSHDHATLTTPELTRADRRDRCGAAARVRAELPSGAELLFCEHHANEHEAKLTEPAAALEVSASE